MAKCVFKQQRVFIMRHGDRLDGLDRKWKLTADRPYDTPLTSHGLSEARELTKRRLSQKVNVMQSNKLKCFVYNILFILFLCEKPDTSSLCLYRKSNWSFPPHFYVAFKQHTKLAWLLKSQESTLVTYYQK